MTALGLRTSHVGHGGKYHRLQHRVTYDIYRSYLLPVTVPTIIISSSAAW